MHKFFLIFNILVASSIMHAYDSQKQSSFLEEPSAFNPPIANPTVLIKDNVVNSSLLAFQDALSIVKKDILNASSGDDMTRISFAINDLKDAFPNHKKALERQSIILNNLINDYNIAVDKKLHTVLPGENLYRIALKYNIDIDILRKNNHIVDDNIVPEQVLFLSGLLLDNNEAKQKTPLKTSKKKTITKKNKDKSSYIVSPNSSIHSSFDAFFNFSDYSKPKSFDISSTILNSSQKFFKKDYKEIAIILFAQGSVESSFNVDAERIDSKEKSHGLFQMRVATSLEILKNKKAFIDVPHFYDMLVEVEELFKDNPSKTIKDLPKFLKDPYVNTQFALGYLKLCDIRFEKLVKRGKVNIPNYNNFVSRIASKTTNHCLSESIAVKHSHMVSMYNGGIHNKRYVKEVFAVVNEIVNFGKLKYAYAKSAYASIKPV